MKNILYSIFCISIVLFSCQNNENLPQHVLGIYDVNRTLLKTNGAKQVVCVNLRTSHTKGTESFKKNCAESFEHYKFDEQNRVIKASLYDPWGRLQKDCELNWENNDTFIDCNCQTYVNHYVEFNLVNLEKKRTLLKINNGTYDGKSIIINDTIEDLTERFVFENERVSQIAVVIDDSTEKVFNFYYTNNHLNKYSVDFITLKSPQQEVNQNFQPDIINEIDSFGRLISTYIEPVNGSSPLRKKKVIFYGPENNKSFLNSIMELKRWKKGCLVHYMSLKPTYYSWGYTGETFDLFNVDFENGNKFAVYNIRIKYSLTVNGRRVLSKKMVIPDRIAADGIQRIRLPGLNNFYTGVSIDNQELWNVQVDIIDYNHDLED